MRTKYLIKYIGEQFGYAVIKYPYEILCWNNKTIAEAMDFAYDYDRNKCE